MPVASSLIEENGSITASVPQQVEDDRSDPTRLERVGSITRSLRTTAEGGDLPDFPTGRWRMLERLSVTVFALGVAAILLYTYANFSAVRFDYWGYVWNPTWSTILTGMVGIAIASFFLPTRLDRPGDIGLYLLLVVVVIPAMVVPSAYSRSGSGDLFAYQLALLVGFGLLIAANAAPRMVFDTGLLTADGYARSLLIFFAIVATPVVWYVGLPRTIPAFSEVYVIRAEHAVAVEQAPFFVGYLWGFIVGVLNPFLVAYGALNRRVALVVTGLLGTLYCYAVSGSKVVLFTLALIAFLYIGMRIIGRSLPLLIGPALWLMAILAKLVDQFIPVPWATTLLVDRALVMPGILTGYYLEFFTENPKAHWAYSFLSRFNEYPYDREPSLLIGLNYYDNPDTFANTHMWADGFANFGYAGMIIVAVVAAVVLWGFNCIALGRDRFLVIPFMAAVFYAFASSSVFTSLLTHGVFLIFVLLLLSPVDQKMETTV